MRLSTRGRYGTRLMLELARNYGKGPISMSFISKTQNIPIKYLEQLIIPLKKARLVKSVRGPKGGHMLTRPPGSISIWEILELLESKYFLVDCLKDDKVCEFSDRCVVRPIWSKAYYKIREVFKKTSLQDILESSPI